MLIHILALFIGVLILLLIGGLMYMITEKTELMSLLVVILILLVASYVIGINVVEWMGG
ncbi:hypothetical protein PQE75_gp146 [Bacillus phage vB_BcoS-136]|uniref:Uncharacterized protein n=1 Tax=Bacillus phage vB_BcoS-136 TaxID=2419619 RepID=A0A3G3BVR7_9CAUD|nr:hypothetical protein PQE75_gp146 [Bacillus phage vB_BcoS-136]AYP68333.1 hypothetical protein vBBcoS136_00219 [Bacillus phage vB_BcoS-136]